MSVSYDHEWSDGSTVESTLQLKTRAQFVHYAEMQRDYVARLLGLPLDPSRDLPALDACKVYDVTLDLQQDRLDQEEPGHVELLEAGDLEVRTVGGSAVTLKPRHFPGLLPFISGVVYAEGQTTVQEPGSVDVRASGGEAVGAFSVQSVSPQRPRLLRVGGLENGATRVKDGAALALSWGGVSGEGDLTYVEVRYTKGERELALRCQPRDDGDFEIPADLIDAPDEGRLTLELVRLRRTSFVAPGLDLGELRVTVRERATLLSH